MRFRTSDRYTLQRIARRLYSRMVRTDGDLTFQDDLGWPVDYPARSWTASSFRKRRVKQPDGALIVCWTSSTNGMTGSPAWAVTMTRLAARNYRRSAV